MRCSPEKGKPHRCPSDLRRSHCSCSSSEKKPPLLPRVYLWEAKYTTNATWTHHPEFPTSALITIQCLISGFVWENSGLDLDVAFTLDKIHDGNPEALVYCTVGGYLFTISDKWDRKPHPRMHADMLIYCGSKRVWQPKQDCNQVQLLKRRKYSLTIVCYIYL